MGKMLFWESLDKNAHPEHKEQKMTDAAAVSETETKKAKGGLKELAVGRTDLYKLAPSDLHIKEGWNNREKNFDPKDELDLALAQSIAEVGVKQPLTVFWEDGQAFISDGHRRLGAVNYAIEHLGADIKSLPVQKEEQHSTEADHIFSQIVRNSGKPFTAIEQAKVFKKLVELGWGEADIAMKAGISKQRVFDLLALNGMPAKVKNLVQKGEVSPTLAITTMKKAKGNGQKTGELLKKAVVKAKSEGKTKATEKHVELAPTNPKTRLRAIFSELDIIEIPSATIGEGGKPVIEAYQFKTDPDVYSEIRSLIGF